MNWIEEIEKRMKIKVTNHEVLKQNDDIDYINETFQRRHLLIHNNGEVNDLYLTKTQHFTVGGLRKGQKLDNSNEYIEEKIKLFKKVGIILVYLYSSKVYKNNMDQFLMI
ncbi:hypothetical protein CV093_10240 [Oceanobacillus sp. 143]|nr:hypothetical protein CV093_10240 [Oceanobacillus sp. 143]